MDQPARRRPNRMTESDPGVHNRRIMPRIANKARLAAIAAIPLLLYWGLLPLFIPLPKLSVDLPGETPFNQDVPITVNLDGWLPNFEILTVRYYVDHARSDVDGPNGPFYPQTIYQTSHPIRWHFTDINRFAWPRHREMTVVLPLSQLAAEGVIQPGTVRGKVDVTLAYPDLYTRSIRTWGERDNRTRMLSEPFEMRFLSAPASSTP